MYIKQVIISGFRSYRDQINIDPFSPKHNVVVGRNGSGKSNFFYAIQFALSDEFSHLRPEQRQSLLHEGTGPRVISAFVEVIFDNSDNRIPIEKDEVVLRRVIGSKKDQYFLDKKMVTKTDVMNLLESAGFSTSNPYYIVKQGKINQMATAPDSYRLKLLREVAGTKVYDERKEESSTILKESEGRREKIDDLLKYIEERLDTLQNEKEELAAYQKWDKQRRSLEYTMHDHELRDARKKLDELADHREKSGTNNQKLREKQQNLSEQVQEMDYKSRELNSKMEGFQDEKDQIMTEEQEEVKKKAQLELKIHDMEEELAGDATAKGEAEKELKKVERLIETTKEELDEINPRYTREREEEESKKHELAAAEQKRKELYAKQGRKNQFASREQRDSWIDKELKALNKAISDKKSQIQRLRDDLENSEERAETLRKQMSDLENDITNTKGKTDDDNKKYYELKKEVDDLNNRRNDLWRKENAMQQACSSTQEEMKQREMQLRSLTGKSVLNGIDSMKRILNDFRARNDNGQYTHILEGYHGTLIENMECEKTFYTCVEVTAGSRLFYHIVDTDDISTTLLKEINRQRLPGEVNIMPLNRLEVRDTHYPETNEAVPMFRKITFDKKLKKAMQHVFGKTLICRSMDVATQIARTQNLDCITLEGEQASRRGTLTGGYYDTRKSRLDHQRAISELEIKRETQKSELDKLKNDVRVIEKEVEKILFELQRSETRLNKFRGNYDSKKVDLKLAKEELDEILKARMPKERSLAGHEQSLKSMEETKNSFTEERGSDLLSQLSAEDQQRMDELNDRIHQLSQQQKVIFKNRNKTESQKNMKESLLHHSLMKKRDRLQQELEGIQQQDNTDQLTNYRNEVDRVDERITTHNDRKQDLYKEIKKLQAEKAKLNNEIEQLKNQEQEYQLKIEQDSKDLEKMTNKHSILIKKKDDAIKKIREIGFLPGAEVLAEHKDLPSKQLFKKLQEVQAELKKYSHVNKKAMEQFVNFSEQKEKLMKRRDELDAAHQSIVELMTVLDHRKYEAITLTFKQVCKNFSEIFSKLVPNGTGNLIMRKGDQDQILEDDDSDRAIGQAAAAGATSDSEGSQYDSIPQALQFNGIAIKVSFTGNKADTRDMQQLSGGQKSLVALALIFAIQKCDPAPFYLFDEIDAALDMDHRKAVADMIHELAENAQFITTTFRSELLEHADKFYGVKFRNKVSHIELIEKEQAKEFVEDDSQHD